MISTLTPGKGFLAIYSLKELTAIVNQLDSMMPPNILNELPSKPVRKLLRS